MRRKKRDNGITLICVHAEGICGKVKFLLHFLLTFGEKTFSMGPTIIFYHIFFLLQFLLQTKQKKILSSSLFSLFPFLSPLFSLQPNRGLTRWQNCVCDFVRMAYRSRNGWCRKVCVWEANGWENSCTCQSSAHMSDKVHQMMLLLVTGLQQGMGPNSHFHVDCGPQF